VANHETLVTADAIGISGFPPAAGRLILPPHHPTEDA
jgi:hypothetical protein